MESKALALDTPFFLESNFWSPKFMESKALALDTPFFWNPNKFYVFFFLGVQKLWSPKL
jgi:hypothetical protein